MASWQWFGNAHRTTPLSYLRDGEEYARLWPLLLDYDPQYAGYKAKTRRKLPVVILRRSDS
jgi:hypothetical protein